MPYTKESYIKHSKNSRTLDMYVRLCDGKIINKTEESERFGVDERSIQRDIDDIRTFLSERATGNSGDVREVIYDRINKGFKMTGSENSNMTNSEIFAVSKILLESRAFTKKEMNSILSKLVDGCVPLKNMKLVSDLIANEKYHYVELRHKSMIQDKLWEIGEDIKEHKLLEIKYQKASGNKKVIKRIVEPVSIIFSEYYFYLNAYIVEKDEKKRYIHKYDYPAIFRLDRIMDYKEIGETFRVNYASRFEEGEFRKRVQFMYPGKLINLKIKFYGDNPEPVLDRLPTATVIEQTKEYSIIEAEVFGKGIIMWLLSQASKVEVLKPDSLRQEIKQQLLDMLKRY
ncbi:MAG: WYL domain-containing protein [Lachnospiraceae bacterium]|nr:WYL domain-containing protein [Lachnospiraceae bacterium]